MFAVLYLMHYICHNPGKYCIIVITLHPDIDVSCDDVSTLQVTDEIIKLERRRYNNIDMSPVFSAASKFAMYILLIISNVYLKRGVTIYDNLCCAAAWY